MHYAEMEIDSGLDDVVVIFIIIRKIAAIIINSYGKDLFCDIDSSTFL